MTRRNASDDFVRRLRHGLARSIEDPSLAAARQALLLDGFEILPSERYEEMRKLEREALERGYREFTQ